MTRPSLAAAFFTLSAILFGVFITMAALATFSLQQTYFAPTFIPLQDVLFHSAMKGTSAFERVTGGSANYGAVAFALLALSTVFLGLRDLGRGKLASSLLKAVAYFAVPAALCYEIFLLVLCYEIFLLVLASGVAQMQAVNRLPTLTNEAVLLLGVMLSGPFYAKGIHFVAAGKVPTEGKRKALLYFAVVLFTVALLSAFASLLPDPSGCGPYPPWFHGWQC